MMNCFSPNDDLSFSLLKSIPRKAFHWLNRLEQDLAEPGSYNCLSWNFSVDCGKLSYADQSTSFSVSWVGNVDNPDEVQSSDDRACDIGNNLDWFTTIEKLIYDELLAFEIYLSQTDLTADKQLKSDNPESSASEWINKNEF